MKKWKILPAGKSPAMDFALENLKILGYETVTDASSHPTHLLLPVPSLDDNGCIRGGLPLSDVMQKLPLQTALIGGMLDHPSLAGHPVLDLLKDPVYLAKNADITAHCAVKLAMNHLACTLNAIPVLVIGWGRIGKCLGFLLRNIGSEVTIAARKEADRAMAQALGFDTVDTASIATQHYRVIFNTVPAPVLSNCQGSALKIDLASRLGIDDKDVLWARGLPGKDAPESAGKLISETIDRLINKE